MRRSTEEVVAIRKRLDSPERRMMPGVEVGVGR